MTIKESFNIFQWVEKLKNQSAVSIVITVVTLLIVSRICPYLFPGIQFLIFAVGVFAASLLLVRSTFYSINKLRSNMRKKSILSNSQIVAVLREINSQSNEISQDNSLRGLPIPVDIQRIADTLQLSIDQVRSNINKLISIGFIIGHIPDEVYNTSSDGKEYLLKKIL